MKTSPLIDDPDNLVVRDMQQICFQSKDCFHLPVALNRVERLRELTLAEIDSSFDHFFLLVEQGARPEIATRHQLSNCEKITSRAPVGKCACFPFINKGQRAIS